MADDSTAGGDDPTPALPADDPWRRPAGVADAAVAAAGKVSEALECVERARGALYDFHQLMGHGDLLLGEAVEALRNAGHDEQADRIEAELVGRNVFEGRWTFQLVEEFDDGYWSVVRAAERRVRDELVGGRRHLFEAEMKEDRRTRGRSHHEPDHPRTEPPAMATAGRSNRSLRHSCTPLPASPLS